MERRRRRQRGRWTMKRGGYDFDTPETFLLLSLSVSPLRFSPFHEQLGANKGPRSARRGGWVHYGAERAIIS